jgi:hypothetical protein
MAKRKPGDRVADDHTALVQTSKVEPSRIALCQPRGIEIR